MGSAAERLAARVARLERLVEGHAASSQLERSSVEGDTLDFYDDDDQLRAAIGLHADGEVTLRHFNGPTPSLPSAASITTKLATLTVTWDGKDVDGSVLQGDGMNVYVSPTDGFVGDESTFVGMIPVPGGPLVLGGLTIGDTLYVRTALVSRSGLVGDQSAQVAVTVTGVSGPDIEANSITTNELEAGSVTGEILSADAIDGKTITGALIRTADTSIGDHLEIGPGTGTTYAGKVDEIRFHGTLPEETYAAKIRAATVNGANIVQIDATEYNGDGTPNVQIKLLTDPTNADNSIDITCSGIDAWVNITAALIRLLGPVDLQGDLTVHGGLLINPVSRMIHEVDYGTTQVDTGPAGGASISHQLDMAPSIVLCQPANGAFQISVDSKNLTDFGVTLYDASGTPLNNLIRTVNWLAIA